MLVVRGQRRQKRAELRADLGVLAREHDVGLEVPELRPAVVTPARELVADYAFRLVVTLFMAIPSFWVALMIVLSLVLTMTWRPPLTIAYFWDDPVRNLQITTGPALALGMALAAMMARITRSSVLEGFQSRR